MTTVRKVTDALGRAEMAEALGVGLTTISAAVVDGYFPSAWYMTIKAMGRKKRVEIPDSLFRWKAADPPKHLAGQP